MVRNLGHEVRLAEGPEEIACTSLYLDDSEWQLLRELPAAVLMKTRTRVSNEAGILAIDVFAAPLAGLVLAEVDSGTEPRCGYPSTGRSCPR